MADQPSKQLHQQDPQGLFLFYWLPVSLYAVLIFVHSAGPSPIQVDLFSWSDKPAHFLVYSILGILLLRAMGATFVNTPHARVILFSIVLASLYGATDELHQYFVPARSAEVFDFLADTAGAVVGVVCYWKLTASPAPKKP
jgi:VanZ family protein